VRLIVPLAPAGATDIIARLIGQWLSERLGQQFVIDNRPGGGGNIGTEAVVRAPADGYTLLLVTASNAINATLYDKLSYNFIRDIAPVAGIIRYPLVMQVNLSFPAKTVPEFISYVKSNPGKISYGSGGIGTSIHVASELFKMMTGVDMIHVPLSRWRARVLGSAVGAAFAASMSTAALDFWGWRIPFLLGLIIGIVGYFLRRHMLETVPVERRKRAPIAETLYDHWRIVVGFAGLSVFSAVGFYVSFVYLVSWLQTADGIPPSRALEINSFSMAIGLPVVIAAGLLSDRFGRKPLLIATSALGLVGAVPLFWMLNHPSALLAQFGQLGLMLIIGLYGGTLPAFLVEAAPSQVRCTAVSLGYNICQGVIGGLTPLVATWLVERTGDEIAPAFLIMAAAAVTAVTVMCFRETYRAPFAGGEVTA
jgi:MFS family permease